MLYGELHATCPISGAANFDQRRAALEKAYNASSVLHEWQKLTKTPDAALVHNCTASFSLRPGLQQCGGVDFGEIIGDVEKPLTRCADVFLAIEGIAAAAGFVYTL